MSGGFCNSASLENFFNWKNRCEFHCSLGTCPAMHTNQNVQIVLCFHGVFLCVYMGSRGCEESEEGQRGRGVSVISKL